MKINKTFGHLNLEKRTKPEFITDSQQVIEITENGIFGAVGRNKLKMLFQ